MFSTQRRNLPAASTEPEPEIKTEPVPSPDPEQLSMMENWVDYFESTPVVVRSFYNESGGDMDLAREALLKHYGMEKESPSND